MKNDIKKIYFLGIPVIKIKTKQTEYVKKIKIKLFGFLPLLKIIIATVNVKIKLFNLITIIKYFNFQKTAYNGDKIHICFALDGVFEKWSSVKTLFDECLKDDKIKISLMRTSEEQKNFLEHEIKIHKNIDIYDFVSKENKILNLEKLNINYFITYNQYLDSLNKCLFGKNAKTKKIKFLFMEYGTTFITENINNAYVLSHIIYKKAYKMFYENDFMFDNIVKFNEINKEKLIVTGRPKFDYILKDKEIINQNLWKLKKTRETKRIIWTPHYTIKENINSSGRHSQFLKYYKLWLEIPKKYPNLDIIMKPHPYLFENIELFTDGEFNKEKVDNWKKEFLNNPNTQIVENKEYDDIFLTSDAIINDSISFIAEYLLTLKPFCLCRNGIGKDGYSEYGEDIAKAYYNAYDENDIINFIENIVLKEIDPLKEEREIKLNKYIHIPERGAGKCIKEFIIDDYNRQ